MLNFKLSKKSVIFLDKLPGKQFKQIVSKIIELTKNPNPHDSKKLTGYDFMRTDIGEYRIIYQYTQEVIEIILIGKRNDDEVYQALRNMLN